MCLCLFLFLYVFLCFVSVPVCVPVPGSPRSVPVLSLCVLGRPGAALGRGLCGFAALISFRCGFFVPAFVCPGSVRSRLLSRPPRSPRPIGCSDKSAQTLFTPFGKSQRIVFIPITDLILLPVTSSPGRGEAAGALTVVRGSRRCLGAQPPTLGVLLWPQHSSCSCYQSVPQFPPTDLWVSVSHFHLIA